MSAPADMQSGPVLALCGGIGGAKLALGLSRVLPSDCLTIAVNTGDDFVHLGLHISPDVDTVLYTLAGLSDRERGWGRADETWNFLSALEQLGGETWFQLGDRDLALHVLRTQALRDGVPLTAFTHQIARQLGVAARVVPMSNDPVRTMVETSDGILPFQQYFVAQRCAPRIKRIIYSGADTARPAGELLDLIRQSNLRAIVICPSNPYLSIDPILAMPGMRQALVEAYAPVIAVSPIIGGAAVKGPTAKIMGELGIASTTKAIAVHYAGLIDGLVIDQMDAADVQSLTVASTVTATLMLTLADREQLAANVLQFADQVAGARPPSRILAHGTGGH